MIAVPNSVSVRKRPAHDNGAPLTASDASSQPLAAKRAAVAEMETKGGGQGDGGTPRVVVTPDDEVAESSAARAAGANAEGQAACNGEIAKK